MREFRKLGCLKDAYPLHAVKMADGIQDNFFQERYGAFYCSNYVSKSTDYTCDDLEAELLALNWLSKRTARHEYFMTESGGIPYSYGNRGMGDEMYVSEKFSPLVHELMSFLNADLDVAFNGCFLNKYDNEQQHLGWHADDFAGMDVNAPIGVVSFGAEREIWVKKKEEKGNLPSEQKILLNRGSLFLMPVGYQDTHFHKIPKHDRPCEWRISLTFRKFN